MADTYQAIYDATRSRVCNGNVGEAVTEAVRGTIYNGDIGAAVENAVRECIYGAFAPTRPSVMYRPRIFMEGNSWCALYGENIQDGVAGFGDSPEAAMADFDAAWQKSLSA